MAAFGRLFLACFLAASGGAPSYAFDGPDKSAQSNQTLDMFKDPHQALQAALESYRAGNPASSVEALKYAAAGGEPLARWKLGKMYADGDGVPRDDYKAYQYFQQIVDNYDEDDSELAGKVGGRQRLRGCRRVRAEGHCRFAPAGGPGTGHADVPLCGDNFSDSNAQYNLARLYMDGSAGLAKDSRQAARWLNLAAEKGHVESQALLGHLLFVGEGVPRQRARGLMWLTLAREGANGKGQDWVRTLYDGDMKIANDNDRQIALVYLEEHLKKRD